MDGMEITILGWVLSVRRQGGLTFLILQDREGALQVTANREHTPRAFEALKRVDRHDYLAIRGRAKRMEKAPRGVEVIPEEVKILGISSRSIPLDPRSKTVRIDRRLDLRTLDLRREKVLAIFKIRSAVLQAIRTFLYDRGYLEVNSPKIIASATEGGAALFPLLYYNKEAFLAQSPQLYKEELTAAFDKVFEIGPVFRAEQFRTLRHLSEITSVDLEEAGVTYEDIMRLLEDLLACVHGFLNERNRCDIEALGIEFPRTPSPVKRYAYDEVLDMLKSKGTKVVWGEDLSTPALQKLESLIPGYYFIVDWPTASKPFYIRPKPSNPEISESFDLMHGSLELASGGTRVSSKKLLVRRLKEKKLNPKSFEYHLRAFDYGMPPHAGFGLGLDRLLMVLTGQENIREVVLYPRDQTRLMP